MSEAAQIDPAEARACEPCAAAPLTEAQSGLWYAQALDPANPIFNTSHLFELTGALDQERFAGAVEQAMLEAEALALRFSDESGEVRQSVDPACRPVLRRFDLSAREDPEAEALAAVRRDQQTPLDLQGDRLAATMLFRLSPERHLWSLRVHHLAADGYAMGLVAGRIGELYSGRRGRPLAPLAATLEEDSAYRASAHRRADAAYWREAMRGLDGVGALASGRAVSAYRCHRFERALPVDLVARIKARAAQAKVSWPDCLTALGGAYCRRFSASAEAVIGVPWMGRMGSASARVPAMVMNVLPVRIGGDESEPLDAWLSNIAARLTEARRHGRYRSEQVRRDLGLVGGERRLHGPLVNVLPFDTAPRFQGLDVAMSVLCTGPVDDIDLTFRGRASPDLTIEVDANPGLYSPEQAEAHLERLQHFIARAVEAPDLASIGIATPREEVRELDAFNRTAHAVPDTTLAALLEDKLRSGGEAEALVSGEARMSYAGLDRASAALARALADKGIGRGDIVAIMLDRSLDLVVALVAALRAGAAYLPLDPDHPPARIQAICDAAAPALVLASEDAHGLFGERLFAPADWPSGHGSGEDGAFVSGAAGGDAAYVIYTSGSTGQPKGVVIEHRAIVNRLAWMQAQYGIGAHSRILQKTPATFDVSVWEFFLALISGGTLVIAPPGAHRDPAAIAGLIRVHRITDLHFVPSMLAAFLSAPQSEGLDVNRVFVSGEALGPDLRDRFHARIKAELHNLYGPTEAAVDVSHWPAGPDDRSSPVPIGWPVWNTRLVIRDPHGHPVAPGMTGELHLGGAQLARGYLGREDLTSERFVPDPHHPGERLYRTGDLARRRPDGAVEFLGREDGQVKIRGLRIELGEIEAAISRTGLAERQAVVAREDRPGDRRLVAYVVPGPNYGEEALKNALGRALPAYMVPAAFMALDALPVTANGKLDRKALPAPERTGGSGREASGETEVALARIVADLLGLEQLPSAEDDFFALGGDSLHAVRLASAIHERWGRDPGLGPIFESPRIEDLARHIDDAADGADHGLGPLIRLARGPASLPPLHVIHPAGGLAWGYRTLARALNPRRTVIGLQSPLLDAGRAPPPSIDALAAEYVDAVLAARADDADGPVHLLGWSVGGIIAQAMAVRLEALGERVGLMAMLDAYPAEMWRDEPEPSEADAMRALLAIAGHDPEGHPELQTRARLVAFLQAEGGPIGSLPGHALDGVVCAVLDTNRLVRGHHHRRFDGTSTHIRAALDHRGTALESRLWEPYAQRLEVVELPFLHAQLTGPEASAMIAPVIGAAMERAERAG